MTAGLCAALFAHVQGPASAEEELGSTGVVRRCALLGDKRASPLDRLTAARELGEHRRDERARKALLGALSDPDPAIRRAATSNVSWTRWDDELRDALCDRIGADVPAVQEEAFGTLFARDVDLALVVVRREWTRLPRRIRLECLTRVVLDHGREKVWIPVLLTAAGDRDEDVATRAVQWIAKGPRGGSPAIVTELVAIGRSDRSASLRAAAVSALGALDARPAPDDLEALLRDPDGEISRAAAKLAAAGPPPTGSLLAAAATVLREGDLSGRTSAWELVRGWGTEARPVLDDLHVAGLASDGIGLMIALRAIAAVDPTLRDSERMIERVLRHPEASLRRDALKRVLEDGVDPGVQHRLCSMATSDTDKEVADLARRGVPEAEPQPPR